MSIVVYYSFPPGIDEGPVRLDFTDDQMSEALAKCRELRDEGFHHVIMSTQLEGQVGTGDRGGVVSDGKLPNGDKYEWSKAHRAGAKSQKEIITK